MGDLQTDQITCATYTHARRHPLVLGRIAGWTPPFQLSLSQVAVIVAVIWVETQTWQWWASPLPRALRVGIAVILPGALAWVIRRARVEGRSLPRAVLGWATLASTPRGGRASGRAFQPARAAAPGRTWVFVARGDDRR